MARIHVLSDDLLFGSRLQAELNLAGHDVTLGLVIAQNADAVVADLTHEPDARLDALDGTRPVIAFYSHVETDVRERALERGIGLVVPRSRMAREPVVLVERMLATAR
jgi:hypothetical protein